MRRCVVQARLDIPDIKEYSDNEIKNIIYTLFREGIRGVGLF